MPNSSIVITFGSDAINGTFIQLETHSLADVGLQNYNDETFQTAPRAFGGEIQVPTPTGTPGEASAIEFAQYWHQDYNQQRNFTVVQAGNVVTITDTTLFWGFGTFDGDGVATEVIVNGVAQTYEITDETASANVSDFCDKFLLSVTTDEVSPNIYLNGLEIETVNAANPYEIDLIRNINNQLELRNAGGQSVFTETYLVTPINEFSIDIDFIIFLSGATVTVSVEQNTSNNPQLIFEYSLDDISYQASNVFTAQAAGSYTMYVRDQFLCVQSTEYEVTELGTADPYLFISKASAIGFKEVVDWDNCSTFKADENTLEFESLTHIPSCQDILYQTCDAPRFQFKSNYATPTATLREEDGTTTLLLMAKMSANLNRFFSLDGTITDYQNNGIFTAIYFDTGNTYDEANLVDGSHSLNGNLPDFAVIGNYIEIEGIGAFVIYDILYDEELEKKIILVENPYTAGDVVKRIKSYYDLLPYEIYEVVLNWSLYGEGLYDILLENSDPNRTTVQHISENIDVRTTHEQTLHIRYYNDNNRDIFYKYGIENVIRVPYLNISMHVKDENELNITDLSIEVVNSTVSEGNRIVFDELVRPLALKLILALSCEHLFINGVGYVKDEEASLENIVNTNLYSVVGTLLKNNISYNNNRQGQSGVAVGTEELNIPAFIIGDGDHLTE
jgi:hypothetical protein